jgi:hypothetical protein
LGGFGHLPLKTQVLRRIIAARWMYRDAFENKSAAGGATWIVQINFRSVGSF